VVLSIPTAAGKSLVAYLAIAQRLKNEGGKAFYIVPLRALAREKYEDLKAFEALGLKIGFRQGISMNPTSVCLNTISSSARLRKLIRCSDMGCMA
jgi:replicative superfamily II helicase